MKIPFETRARTTPQSARADTQATPKRILVVDDDPGVRESLLAVLRGEGYQVLAAAGGVQALSFATNASPDLVLLDLNMPDQSGWDTFERLTSENPPLPVIVITARPNQLFTALNAGVGALLEKPLDIPVLLQTVKTLLAEPTEVRLARIAGHNAPFHYLPQGGQYRETKGRGHRANFQKPLQSKPESY
jgi:CheY-like chemotaxis protein